MSPGEKWQLCLNIVVSLYPLSHHGWIPYKVKSINFVLQHTNTINDIVESLISDVEWYYHGKSSNEYSEIEDFFRETNLEPPKQIGVR